MNGFVVILNVRVENGLLMFGLWDFFVFVFGLVFVMVFILIGDGMNV